MWKQSPICHLPVIYLFGLVTGSSYCSLESETVGKQHKKYGKFIGKTGGASKVRRGCKEEVQERPLPSERDTQGLGWGLGAGGVRSSHQFYSADLQLIITKLDRRRGRKGGGERRRKGGQKGGGRQKKKEEKGGEKREELMGEGEGGSRET